MTIVLFIISISAYFVGGVAFYPIYKKLGGHKTFEAYINQL